MAALASRSPGACLCSVESFSLSFGSMDTSPRPGRSRQGWGWRGAGGGSGNREERAKTRFSGWHGCQEESPNAWSGQKATFPGSWACWDLLETGARLADRGGQWTQNSQGQQEEGPPGSRGGGFSESHKLKTERMSGHLHFLPLLMGIIPLAPSFPEADFK